jgi:hypothetical protein
MKGAPMKRPCRAFLCIVSVLAGAGSAHAEMPKVGVTAGASLPSGLAHFADPTVYHGLTMGLQAGLGASDKSATFGYDGVVGSARYNIPDPNSFGNRISLMAGVADWYTPPLARVYPSSALTPEELLAGSVIVNALVIGMSLRLFGDRDPSAARNPKLWEANHDRLASFDAAIVAATIANRPDEVLRKSAERDDFVWRNILRPILRRPTLSAGALLRGGLASSSGGQPSTVSAVDGFLAFSLGKGVFDFSSVLHVLKTFDQELVLNYAFVGSVGGFIDLSDAPPPSVVGLSASAGFYQYEPRSIATGGIAPSTFRVDGVLSFSLAPVAGYAAGIGLKYSHLSNSDVKNENQLLLLLSTDGKWL